MVQRILVSDVGGRRRYVTRFGAPHAPCRSPARAPDARRRRRRHRKPVVARAGALAIRAFPYRRLKQHRGELLDRVLRPRLR
jgi:hypothetical protein